MTDQLQLNRVLGAFLATGTDELADRVIDAALDQIDHTPQRRALRTPWRFPTMTMFTRLAAAAVIGVIAVGGAFYVLNAKPPAVGNDHASASPGATATGHPPLPSWIPSDRPHPTGPMGVGRQIQAASRLADGRVLVTGGFDYYDLPLASGSLYDPSTRSFSPTAEMSAARGYQTSTLLQDGRVLIAGGGRVSWSGTQTDPFLASAELYDPATGTFKATGSMSVAREDHTATLLSDGRVLIVGGDDAPDHGLATAELYDPKTGTFSPTGLMSAPRGFHAATLLVDGRVLITGGTIGTWGGTLRASAELYDPKTGTFSQTGSMLEVRAWHTATRLLDGRVLLTGGTISTNQVEAELYNPTTGTFTATGSMLTGRQYHTATLLLDGRVLVAGGGNDYTNLIFISNVEIYDPKTGTFTATGSLATARTYHTATLLSDGHVLITGGYGPSAPLADGEIWDPATGSFGPAS